MNNPNNTKSTYRIVRIPLSTAESVVGPLLEFPFSLASDNQYLWLRYPADNEPCRNLASTIPAEHFYLQSNDLLIRESETIASSRLPQLTWSPAKEFVQIVLPTANLAGRLQINQLSVWELKRGGKEREPAAALYSAEVLADWIAVAPDNRLATLRFCTAQTEHHNLSSDKPTKHAIVFVFGKPLPPVPCHFLCQYDRIFIPIGYHWEPNLDSSLIEQSCGLPDNHWLLWTSDFGWSTINQSQCVPLTRAALRSTLREGTERS
jgi:hypothetical protein